LRAFGWFGLALALSIALDQQNSDWQLFDVGKSMSRDFLTYLALFTILWLALFRVWTKSARLRLIERDRPTWSAHLPAGLSLVWIVMVSFGVAWHLQNPDWVGTTTATDIEVFVAVGLIMGLPVLAALAFVWVTIDCLLPSRRTNPEDVFD
jgi:hypothetical protein